MWQQFVNDDIAAAETTWLQAIDQDFFAKGFHALVSSRVTCSTGVVAA
jgi:hypothetical protein